MARASVPDASWTPSWEVFWVRPTRRRPRGRPRTRWRDYVSRLAWERRGIPRRSRRKCLGRGKSGHLCLDCCPRDRISRRRWMDRTFKFLKNKFVRFMTLTVIFHTYFFVRLTSYQFIQNRQLNKKKVVFFYHRLLNIFKSFTHIYIGPISVVLYVKTLHCGYNCCSLIILEMKRVSNGEVRLIWT